MHRYVSENQALVIAACNAIEGGEVDGLADAMYQSQQLFDNTAAMVCPRELSSPRLHEVLTHPLVHKLTLAGKGVGSQGDGSVQLLCSGEVAQKEVIFD